jgi:hypothetical protein
VQNQPALSQFDFHLTSEDEKTLKAFRTLLKLDGITEFSSDDFRRYGLDRFIRDTQHGIGSFFSKLKHEGLVVEVGSVRSTLASNHSRTIRVYKWKTEASFNV